MQFIISNMCKKQLRDIIWQGISTMEFKIAKVGFHKVRFTCNSKIAEKEFYKKKSKCDVKPAGPGYCKILHT